MKRLLNTLYLTNPDAYLRKKDDALAVYVEQKKVMSVPFHLLEGVVLFGHVGCSTAVLGACATRGISVAILDEGGRFQASVRGPISGNVLLRREQYRRSMDVTECLSAARRFVAAKVHNSRVVLQHYVRDYADMVEIGAGDAIRELKQSGEEIRRCNNLDELRGIEEMPPMCITLRYRGHCAVMGSLLPVVRGDLPKTPSILPSHSFTLC